MIIMVTDWSMYLLKNGTFEVLYYAKIEYLTRIIQLTTDTNVFALNFAGKEIKNKQGTQAFLFDSARRAELILFIQTVCANNPNRKAPPVVKRTESINITSTVAKKKERETVSKFDTVPVVSNDQRLRMRGLNTKCDYVLSTQFGYLQRKVDGWYKTWSEQFFVLTDIGLVMMSDPFDTNMEYF
jgi:hypothetical protein